MPALSDFLQTDVCRGPDVREMDADPAATAHPGNDGGREGW